MNGSRCCVLFLVVIASCGILTSKSSILEGTPEEKDSYQYTYNNDLRLYHPFDFTPMAPEKRFFPTEHIDVFLYADGFYQGRVVYAELYKNRSSAEDFSACSIIFDGVEYSLTRRDWGYRALFAISPELKPGKKKLEIWYINGFEEKKIVIELTVGRHEFPYSRYPMDLGKYSDVEYEETPEIQAFIRECIEKKNKVFSSSSPDYMNDSLAHPRDFHYITSEFWEKRTIVQYKWRNGKKVRLKNRIKVHRGIDLRGTQGKPVYAIADGKIVLAEALYYEGNMVIIDHGNRIFSYYMHLDSFKVSEGSVVRPGQLIGYVGSTGVSTAPHLHVSFIINGIQVDPLSVLSLPLR